MSAISMPDSRLATDDLVHVRLRKAVERQTTSYLWIKGDTPPFRPALSPLVYGDGRSLFAFTTLNQRPRYWVIRGDSRWGCDYDYEDSKGPEIRELSDDIMTDLEEQFGSGRCSYSGSSLFWPKYERIRSCRCEECIDGQSRARWPMVDGSGGCSWGRMKWPKGFDVVENTLSRWGNLLAF
jgi:hypothetical protein